MIETYRIETTNASGQVVRFSLFQDMFTAPTLELLPLVGYRLRFQMSRDGFGVLNRQLSLEILDDESGTFFNLFSGLQRDDVRIEIRIGGSLFMLAYADYEQLTTLKFIEQKRVIRVTAYEAYQFKLQTNSLAPKTRERIYNELSDVRYIDLETATAVTNEAMMIEDFYRNILFEEYKTLLPNQTMLYSNFITNFVASSQEFFYTKGSSGEQNEREIKNLITFSATQPNFFAQAGALSGTIQTDNTQVGVNGAGTFFESEINEGDRLFTNRFELIGIVESISSDEDIDLQQNAEITYTGVYYINIDEQRGVTLASLLQDITKQFFARVGFSITHNTIFTCQNNMGKDGTYRIVRTFLPKVKIDTANNANECYDADFLNTKVFAGIISSSTGSSTVTGVNTLFTEQVEAGDRLYTADDYSLIGIVGTIASDTSLDLIATASINTTNKRYVANLNFDFDVPVIERNKLQQEVTLTKVAPYRDITYRQQVVDKLQTGFVPLPSEFSQTVTNTAIDDSEIHESVEFTLPFAFGFSYTVLKNEAEKVLFAFNDVDKLEVILDVKDEISDNSGNVLSVYANNVADIRFDIRDTLRGTYKGLLDPLIPHKTNIREGIKFARFKDLVEEDGGFIVAFSHTGKVLTELSDADSVCPCSAGEEGKLYFRNMTEKAYIITRGEYDLLRGETIIQESISLFEIEE